MSGAAFQQDIVGLFNEVADEFGTGSYTVTIERPATQPENPWDAPAGSPTSYTINAAVDNYAQDKIDGTLIRAGDRRVLIDPTVIEPTTADRVVIDGDEYAIIDVQAEAPAGVALLYILQCRK